MDEALDANTALIYSPKAPLAGLFSPKGATPPPDPDQVRKDDRAVWAFVPSTFTPDKPEVLIYLHGHNYFVTAKRNVATSKVEARVSDWLLDNEGKAGAAAKGAAKGPAGNFYDFDKLAASLPHHPLILLPEDGHNTHDLKQVLNPDKTPKVDPVTNKPVMEWDGFWCKELPGTLATATGLGDLIENCSERLSVLPVVPANGKNYLGKKIAVADIKRLFLTGHSGGGVPLDKAITADISLNTPTTLVVLDATYNDYRASLRKFCETWKTRSKLKVAADSSWVVIIFNPASGTAGHKTTIVADLKKNSFTVTELKHAQSKGTTAVETALSSNEIVVIETDVAHDGIPQFFIPLVLKNTP